MDAPAAPTLTVGTDPSPNVEVYFPVLHGDVDTITVHRIADGITEPVAGALRASATGDFVITDHLVPLDIAVTYVGEAFDAGGASLTGAQASVEVPSNGVTWLSDTLDPTVCIAVTDFRMASRSLATIRKTRDRKFVYVAALAQPFIQDWGLKGIESLPLQVFTDTNDEAVQFKHVAEASQLAIRTPAEPFVTLPRLLYASIGQPTHRPDWSLGTPRILWTIEVDEAQPMSKAVVRPLITWDDWIAAFPEDTYTWNDVMAVYGAGTWTDAMRNPPNA